jgi:DNA repair exonuclease SbcCD ATPase subunit
MSTDPYHAVQEEIQSTLANAGTLLQSFRRIRAMAPEGSEGEEMAYARNELKATLSALEADLEELEESVKYEFWIGLLRSNGIDRMFGLVSSNRLAHVFLDLTTEK